MNCLASTSLKTIHLSVPCLETVIFFYFFILWVGPNFKVTKNELKIFINPFTRILWYDYCWSLLYKFCLQICITDTHFVLDILPEFSISITSNIFSQWIFLFLILCIQQSTSSTFIFNLVCSSRYL